MSRLLPALTFAFLLALAACNPLLVGRSERSQPVELQAPLPTATTPAGPGTPLVAILSPLHIDAAGGRLFAVAQVKNKQGKPITVQPVSLSYTRLDGIPLGRHWRPFYTWFGDMELAPHAWQMAGLGEVEVIVNFHEPVSLADFADRKALAEHCFKVVYEGVAASNSGRLELLPPPRKAA